MQATQTSSSSLERALTSEQAARQQTTAALKQERLVHTKTATQLEAAQALATERQRLRDEALSERDTLRTEFEVVRRDATLATEQRQRENANLTPINSGLSVRIDKTQSALASTEA